MDRKRRKVVLNACMLTDSHLYCRAPTTCKWCFSIHTQIAKCEIHLLNILIVLSVFFAISLSVTNTVLDKTSSCFHILTT